MPMFGVHLYPTAYSMDPIEVVKAAEERGLDSATYPEHTHIPTSRKTPFPFGGELPKHYAELHDPFIVMAAAGKNKIFHMSYLMISGAVLFFLLTQFLTGHWVL